MIILICVGIIMNKKQTELLNELQRVENEIAILLTQKRALTKELMNLDVGRSG